MECSSCHQDKPDVVEAADPHLAEIYDELVMVALCEDCYEQRLADT